MSEDHEYDRDKISETAQSVVVEIVRAALNTAEQAGPFRLILMRSVKREDPTEQTNILCIVHADTGACKPVAIIPDDINSFAKQWAPHPDIEGLSSDIPDEDHAKYQEQMEEAMEREAVAQQIRAKIERQARMN